MRRAGLALLAFVFLGTVSHVWTPQSAPAEASSLARSPAAVPSSHANAPAGASEKPSGPFVTKIQEKIRTFFALPLAANGKTCVDAPHYCVPSADRTGIRFVIATVPDPVHTHLAHFFDTGIEAIEQGAFNDGYLFDRAIMPWPYPTTYPDAASAIVALYDVASRQTPKAPAKPGDTPQDSFPGLMIFRESELRLKHVTSGQAPTYSNPLAAPLFVFVVGETPTAGINEDQFRNAVQIIHEIRKGTDRLDPGDQPDFGIVGPTFSGSLFSMRASLQKYVEAYRHGYEGKGNSTRILPVYAAVLGTSAIDWFQTNMPDHVRMVLFQQDSATVLHALFDFVSSRSYEKEAVAVLNEDETAYGAAYRAADPGTSASAASGSAKMDPSASEEFVLFFPRGISQFRSDYTKDVSATPSGTPTGNAPTNLPLDLQATGSDDDSVAPYAKTQTSLAQEAVMLGIISELRQHEAKFVLLRATDPLDELFLAQYLHSKYPQGRIVVPTPDLLFAREGGTPLDGVLGISTYPLTPSLPDSLSPLCTGASKGETFRSAFSIATYNATTALIRQLGDLHDHIMDIPPSADKSAAGGPAVANADTRPCTLSPNLWLTLVSRNAIRPVKVLGVKDFVEQSKLFPTGVDRPREESQHDSRVPLWIFAYIVCVAAMLRHSWLSWHGGDFGSWMTAGQYAPPGERLQRKAWLLFFGGVFLVAMFIVVVAVRTPVTQFGYHWWPWIALVLYVAFTMWDFWHRRGERSLTALFFTVVIVLNWVGLHCVSQATDDMVLWQQRTLNFASGASPATPVLFLLIALYSWFWYAFRAEGLLDWRRPRLPVRESLPVPFYLLSRQIADRVYQSIHWWEWPSWVWGWSLFAVLCVAVPAAKITPGHVAVRSLEGLAFDGAYSFLLAAAVVVLLATLLRLLAIWNSLVHILRSMDRYGMRDALRRLYGFEWNVIWNPAWSVDNEDYKMMTREIQILERLQKSLGVENPEEPPNLRHLRRSVHEIMNIRQTLIGIAEGAQDEAEATRRLMLHYERLLLSFAGTVGFLLKAYLADYWKTPREDEKKGEPDQSAQAPPSTVLCALTPWLSVSAGTAGPEVSELSLPSLRFAEEFVATCYANFLVTVLLAVRGLVFTAVVLYACIVLSTVSYPFQPAPNLTIMAAVLFAFSGYVVWYVYEEMHRDPTLSRVTSTTPGKLDAAFWTKFAAAGVVPLVALITTVYPPFGHLLYTLVGPLLQALR